MSDETPDTALQVREVEREYANLLARYEAATSLHVHWRETAQRVERERQALRAKIDAAPHYRYFAFWGEDINGNASECDCWKSRDAPSITGE